MHSAMTPAINQYHDPKRATHHTLLVGGGPRSIIQTKAEIAFMLLYTSHFQQLVELGAEYDIRTTIVEKQRRVGAGASFSASQTGMANTGIEGDIEFPFPTEIKDKEEVDEIMSILSYKRRYEERFEKNPEQYHDVLKGINLPGSVMFRRSVGPMSASPCGKLDHLRAYLMRKTIGEEEYEHFNLVKRIAKMRLPFYKLNVVHSTLLEQISVGDSAKPAAKMCGVDSKHSRWLEVDQIRLNTGTTIKNPVARPSVRARTFCQAMNAEDMRRFFSKRQLLGENGTILPGTKILCAGLGLSALDQLSALDGLMTLFERDDRELLGYRVTDEAKSLYQGAITFVSRTPGKACVPRHSFAPEWTQESPVIGTTKHLFSLFLHQNGEQVFGLWIDIMKAAVARASNCTPDDLDAVKSTPEVLSSNFAETCWFLDCRRKAGLAEMQGDLASKQRLLIESTKTRSGAWRQAALSLILGFAPEEDIEQATADMERLAPITYKGRDPMRVHRAQIYSITHPRASSHRSNKKFVANMRNMMQYVTASPVEIHSIFHLLLEAGIAKYVSASYSDIWTKEVDNRLQLGGEQYDALVVSPTFERNANPAVQSLVGQVRPFHPSAPCCGEVGKFREFVSSSGNPVAVEDYGLGGAGFQLTQGKGKGSLVGAFAPDINNRASAVSTAASNVMRRMALCHLKSAGVDAPSSTLAAMYEAQKPEEASYVAEVYSFARYFEEVWEMWAFVQAVQKVTKHDSVTFQKLYDYGTTSAGRRAVIAKMMNSGILVEREAAAQYQTEVFQKMQTFSPPGRDEYFARFVDSTLDEDAAVYQKAFELAKKTLTGIQH